MCYHVIFQTTWFLLQYVARASQRFALTELDLATAAFALLSIVTSGVWWDKPLDVQCPIRVRRKHARDKEEDVSTGEGNTQQLWALVLVALIFGGIHCIGWSFHFPSHAELLLLWQMSIMSSIAITGIPRERPWLAPCRLLNVRWLPCSSIL